jgi:UDP-glucose 4-epimerase
MGNLAGILAGMEFWQGDLCDASLLGGLCAGVDCIFHEAAIASVPRSIDNPVESNRVNVDGTVLLLQMAQRCGVRRVVFAASAAAYGNSSELPQRESMLPQALSPYGAQKLACEHYLQSFWHVHGLETVGLRYFNVFGPRQDPSSPYSGVLSIFIDNLLAGREVCIYGDGQNSRDFTYIDNVVQANLLAMQVQGPAVTGKVFNVATGRSTTLLEVYEAARRVIGGEPRLRFAAPRAGDPRASCADISLAGEVLGYVPTVFMEEGIRRTVDWYRGRRREVTPGPRLPEASRASPGQMENASEVSGA